MRPAQSAPGCRYSPRLQGHRQVGPRDVHGIDVPGVRVDAAGHVDRDDLRAPLAGGIHRPDGLRLRALGRTGKTAAEHGIDEDDAGSAAQRLFRVLAARRLPRLRSQSGVAFQAVRRSREPDVDLRDGFTQQARGDGSVAAVVSRAAEGDHLSRLQLEHRARDGAPGALHQDPGGQRRLRRGEPIQLALPGGGQQPHPIRSFMSRTARSRPVRIARQTIA